MLITPGPGAVIYKGTYTGSGADNLAVPHLLGKVPKYVLLNEPTGQRFGLLQNINGVVILLNLVNGAGIVNLPYAAITVPTALYFYVGEALSMAVSFNVNATVYYFVAIG